jgi:hypothetical protein
VIALVGIALLGGYGAGVVVDAAKLTPLLAVAVVTFVVAAFAWRRRDYDILEVAGPSFLVAYAGYAGIAVARAAHAVATAPLQALPFGPLADVGVLAELWPMILVGGIPFALVLTVVVALPISMIPVRRRTDSRAHDALWKFIEERNAQRETGDDIPKGPDSPT